MTWDYKGGNDFYSGLVLMRILPAFLLQAQNMAVRDLYFPNSVYLKDGKYVPNTNIVVQDGNYAFL